MADETDSTHPPKACKWCGEVKPFNKFPKAKGCRVGRANKCHACVHQARSPKSKAAALARSKAWKKRRADHWREVKRQQGIRARRLVGVRPLEQVRAEAARKVEEANKEKIARLAERLVAKPWTAPGLSAGERFALRYKLDPEFNLRQRLRAGLRRKRQGVRLDRLVREAVARDGSSPKCEEFLGYAVKTLRRHLERQFTPDMTWSAFCEGLIHIDHIRPLARFDLTVDGELKAAWALSNLRPLWAPDNLSKSSKVVLLV